MSSQGDEQHRNMGDGAVIPRSRQADDGRVLHGDRQQPRKSSFHRASLMINRLEVMGSIIDRVADAWRKAKKIIAPFLIHELGMSGRTEKILASIGLAPVKGTRVLKIGSPFRSHPAFAMHGEIGGTEDGILLEAEGRVLLSAGIDGDDGMGFHLEGDVGQDVFAVIIGVPGNRRNREGQSRGLSKHGNGDLLLIPIVGVSDFRKGEFGFRVDDDMVSVAPVERHLRLEGLGKMDFYAEPSVGIAARKLRLVETVLDRGFEIVLPDVGLDGTGIQGQNAAADNFVFDERLDEIYPNFFQVLVGRRAEEAGEAFPGRRMLKYRKSAGRCDGRVVFQFEGQVGQRRKAAQTLIDQSAKKSFLSKGRSSSDVCFLNQRRQVGKQFFETNPRRNFFGLEKAPHDTLDFREGRRKTPYSRVSKARRLGYVADSYEKRLVGKRRGVARKSVFLTRAKRKPKIRQNYEFSILGIGASG
jgi:hypothetical protein